MRILTGTSGFSFDEWSGTFYPEGLPPRQRLGHYASRLRAVEINNTFYRMPKPEIVRGWAAQVPDDFRFVLKAPQRITHKERLVGSEESLGYFLRAAAELGPRMGALLFQLPPFLRKAASELVAFLALVPAGVRLAFEFRHPSWFCEEIYDALRARDAALVGGDADASEKSPPLVATASFGYLRLRAPSYSDDQLDDWAAKIRDQPWGEALVFLKHEVRGPEFAGKLASRFQGSPPTPRP